MTFTSANVFHLGMGILRLILAVGVMLEHARVWTPIAGSHIAVEAFFIVSGFYMSLIYPSRYKAPREFFRSRFLRLFPAYWTILLGSLFYLAFGGGFKLPPENLGFFFFSNVFILGADVPWFFPNIFGRTDSILAMVIPPVWTLSLELMFYALCPWLLRLRTRTIFVIALLSFIARFIGYGYGLNENPWHARFFPFELGWFLLGVLTHRIYQQGGWSFAPVGSTRALALCAACGAFAVGFNYLSLNAPIRWAYGLADWPYAIAFYSVIVASLPGLYHMTEGSRIDRYLGEYSYPVYLWHFAIIAVFVNPWIIVPMTLVHAAAVVHLVQTPLDVFRHQPGVRKATAAPPQ